MQQSKDNRQQAAKRQSQKAGSAPSAVYRTDEPLRCPNCGSLVGPTDRFCEECGTSLQAVPVEKEMPPVLSERTAPVSEKRQENVSAEVETLEKKEAAPDPNSQNTTTEGPLVSAPPSLPLLALQERGKKKESKAAVPAPKSKKKSTPKNAMLQGILERSQTKSNVDVPQLAYNETVERQRNGWVCNWCGCWHHHPGECSRPDLGGTWLYRTHKTTKITKV